MQPVAQWWHLNFTLTETKAVLKMYSFWDSSPIGPLKEGAHMAWCRTKSSLYATAMAGKLYRASTSLTGTQVCFVCCRHSHRHRFCLPNSLY